jgi:hypothetical protein
MARQVEWCACIDIGEFMFPSGGASSSSSSSIASALATLPARINEVKLRWRTFGSAGLASRNSTASVLDTFRWRESNMNELRHFRAAGKVCNVLHTSLHRGKRIMRTGIRSVSTPHFCIVRGESAQRIAFGDDIGILLNHYSTKSRQEYQAKMERGRPTLHAKLSFQQYRRHNCNHVYDQFDS